MLKSSLSHSSVRDNDKGSKNDQKPLLSSKNVQNNYTPSQFKQQKTGYQPNIDDMKRNYGGDPNEDDEDDRQLGNVDEERK